MLSGIPIEPGTFTQPLTIYLNDDDYMRLSNHAARHKVTIGTMAAIALLDWINTIQTMEEAALTSMGPPGTLIVPPHTTLELLQPLPPQMNLFPDAHRHS